MLRKQKLLFYYVVMFIVIVVQHYVEAAAYEQSSTQFDNKILVIIPYTCNGKTRDLSITTNKLPYFFTTMKMRMSDGKVKRRFFDGIALAQMIQKSDEKDYLNATVYAFGCSSEIIEETENFGVPLPLGTYNALLFDVYAEIYDKGKQRVNPVTELDYYKGKFYCDLGRAYYYQQSSRDEAAAYHYFCCGAHFADSESKELLDCLKKEKIKQRIAACEEEISNGFIEAYMKLAILYEDEGFIIDAIDVIQQLSKYPLLNDKEKRYAQCILWFLYIKNNDHDNADVCLKKINNKCFYKKAIQFLKENETLQRAHL